MGCLSSRGFSEQRVGLFPQGECSTGCRPSRGFAEQRVGLFPQGECSTGCRAAKALPATRDSRLLQEAYSTGCGLGQDIAEQEIARLLRDFARDLVHREPTRLLVPVRYTYIACLQTSHACLRHQGPSCLNAVEVVSQAPDRL